MKHQLKHFLLGLLTLCFFTGLQAQVTISNSRLIYPGPGAFNPLAKFTGIGESGGVPGPTITGCDLYGFRSQITLNQSINVGMEDFGGRILPVTSFESEFPYLILETNATGTGTGSLFGCGKLLAYFKDQSNGTVFRIFGDGFATGGVWIPSDRQLKRDIQPIANATDKIMQLNGVSYFYRHDERPELGLPTRRTVGFITQDVKKVIPEAVKTAANMEGGEADYDVMQYDAILPVLTEAFKEQQQVITELQDRYDEQVEINLALEDRLAKLEALLAQPQTPSIGATSPAAASSVATLSQNRPNPTDGLTTINYTIAEDANNAQLVIYDINGVALQTIPVAAGSGSVDVNVTNFTSGTYIYAIVVDGKNLARQKMVVK